MNAPTSATTPRRPLCVRNFLASGCLAIFFFFASAFVGMAAARFVIPGSAFGQTLAAFMLPLGWALGWLGVRHLALAFVTLLAPIVLPFLLLWLLWRAWRPAPTPAGEPAVGWRRDPALFLIVPACALTSALVGAIGAFNTAAPILLAMAELATVGGAWGLVLAVLQFMGVLPDEERDLGVPA